MMYGTQLFPRGLSALQAICQVGCHAVQLYRAVTYTGGDTLLELGLLCVFAILHLLGLHGRIVYKTGHKNKTGHKIMGFSECSPIHGFEYYA